MNRKVIFGGLAEEAIPFNGQISMIADDASQLVLNAVSVPDTTTLQVDSTYRYSVGNVTELKAQNFVDLAISAF